MDDIVAIKVIDKKKGEGAFITWGRLFHIIDDTELLETVKKNYSRWGYELESIELCYSLMEISHYPYFFECLIRLAQQPIPYGNKYNIWKRKKIKALKQGDDIYFTGFMKDYLDYLERKERNFAELPD